MAGVGYRGTEKLAMGRACKGAQQYSEPSIFVASAPAGVLG